MRHYTTGTWGLTFILTCSGSVFPKAVVWAWPAVLASIAINLTLREAWEEEFKAISEDTLSIALLGSYNAVLGFILVFRSQLAYARWWEGGTLLAQLRGEWFNAYSSLIAFCSAEDDKQGQVESFQQLLVRLMSLLHGCALQQVSTMERKEFDIFDLEGLDREHLNFLRESSDKCEVTLQWIQRLVVQHSMLGTIQIPPPILTRVFQELSRGIVNLNNARKITEFLFPFPWSQMITVMLLIQVMVTPIIAGIGIKSLPIGASVTFLVVFASFGIHYIAQELENPYGDDANDLPLREMQIDMNQSMMRLLDPRAQSPPTFAYRSRASWANQRKTGESTVIKDEPVLNRSSTYQKLEAEKRRCCDGFCLRCCIGKKKPVKRPSRSRFSSLESPTHGSPTHGWDVCNSSHSLGSSSSFCLDAVPQRDSTAAAHRQEEHGLHDRGGAALPVADSQVSALPLHIQVQAVTRSFGGLSPKAVAASVAVLTSDGVSPAHGPSRSPVSGQAPDTAYHGDGGSLPDDIGSEVSDGKVILPRRSHPSMRRTLMNDEEEIEHVVDVDALR